MHSNINIHYRPDIDGLRALAVLGVIFFHAFPDTLTGGYVGVDVFFVISGYLITSIITKNYRHGGFSYTDFYLRRFKRIFPALVTVLLTTLVAGWYTMLPMEYEQTALHSLSGLGFVANINLYLESGYFDAEAETKALLHLWSLGIEEQFYLLWPFILGLLIRANNNLPRITLLLLGISFALSAVLTPGHPEASFFLIHTRAWELLAGAYLAVSANRSKTTLTLFYAPAGLLLIVGSYVFLHKTSIFPGWLAAFPVLGAFLIIHPANHNLPSSKLLANPVVVYIGKISFPLYLWHWPLLTFLRLLEPEAGSGATFLALTAATLLSILTYHFVESPLRHGNTRRTIVLAILTLIVGALSYNIYSRNGLDQRLRNAQEKTAERAIRWGDARRTDAKCEAMYRDKFTGHCLIMDEQKKPDAMIIGDSHANHLYWGLASTLGKAGINLLQAASAGCVPLPEIMSDNNGQLSTHCSAIIEPALDFAINSPDIKTIFLAGRWSTFLTGRELRKTKKQGEEKILVEGKYRPDLSRSDIFAQQMERLLQKLVASGKRIVFVYDIHELPYKASHCATWSPNPYITRQPKKDCFMPIDQVLTRDNEFRPQIEQSLAKFPQVIVLDPRQHLCDNTGCWGIENGQILFRDDDHLSYSGSLIVGEKLANDFLNKAKSTP
jgi:peptidoglycan/LPS O-acetylase OafA/YrhL